MPENQQAERTVEALLERARGIAQMAAERTQVIEQQQLDTTRPTRLRESKA